MAKTFRMSTSKQVFNAVMKTLLRWGIALEPHIRESRYLKKPAHLMCNRCSLTACWAAGLYFSCIAIHHATYTNQVID